MVSIRRFAITAKILHYEVTSRCASKNYRVVWLLLRRELVGLVGALGPVGVAAAQRDVEAVRGPVRAVVLQLA